MLRSLLRPGLAVLFAVSMSGGEALAQEASTHPSNLPQAPQAEGVPVESVSIRLRTPADRGAQDEAILATLRRIAAELEGNPFNMIETARAVARMEREASVARVEYRLLPAGANALRILFLVDAAPSNKKGEDLPKGVLAREHSDFPTLYKDDSSLVTAIVAGGLVRLFGSDEAFFLASAFGGGTTDAIDKANCASFAEHFKAGMTKAGAE